MRVNKDIFLYSSRDNLVSGKKFEIYWDKKHHIAWTSLENEKITSKYYRSDQYDSHKSKPQSAYDYLYAFIQSLMLLYKWLIIKRRIRSKCNILDIGGGTGFFANFCSSKGLKSTVVETSSKSRNICKEKNINSFKSIYEISISNHYGLVTLWHSLEHITSPDKILNKIYDILEPKGLLVIALPNFKSHDSSYYKSNWAGLDVPRHLWHFTKAGIEQMAHNSNFSLVKSYPLWMDSFYISYLSELNRNSYFPFLKGVVIGFIFNLISFFTGEYSSKIYLFKKKI
jgi:2-polyprenyl-3-methyl-5-hydroxy-6-metoxy-1,4-benzoquinol methylase